MTKNIQNLIQGFFDDGQSRLIRFYDDCDELRLDNAGRYFLTTADGDIDIQAGDGLEAELKAGESCLISDDISLIRIYA